ncbi:hypothetical protein AAFF_G00141820 [Aldrovandia affinis]|uniref:Uncharacterized protein n=1 Tax=Aldrovandia affinis TaxID=143900 RepID=A0AAD7TDX8_9TELE|nr:hypothetical protein AAFF_G00141820 [Aldrovandia affinis]
MRPAGSPFSRTHPSRIMETFCDSARDQIGPMCDARLTPSPPPPLPGLSPPHFTLLGNTAHNHRASNKQHRPLSIPEPGAGGLTRLD